jgi:hypothetical protein
MADPKPRGLTALDRLRRKLPQQIWSATDREALLEVESWIGGALHVMQRALDTMEFNDPGQTQILNDLRLLTTGAVKPPRLVANIQAWTSSGDINPPIDRWIRGIYNERMVKRDVRYVRWSGVNNVWVDENNQSFIPPYYWSDIPRAHAKYYLNATAPITGRRF